MPNNFKLSGNMYVSKAGNDANAGTSPDAPKRTFLAGLNAISAGGTLIIGAGVYSESFTTTNALANNNTLFIKGDGDVILDGENRRSITFLSARSSGTNFENITIRNYSTSRAFTTSHTGLPGSGYSYTNCTFINCDAYFGVNNSSQFQTFSSCKIINCNFDFSLLTSSSVISITKCIVINSTLNGVLTLLNSNVNAGINFIRSGAIAANNNYNNLYQTPIVMSVASTVTSGVIQDTYNRYYDLSLAGTGGSGSLSEPFKRDDTILKPFNFSSHRIAYPTFNASSSAVDPKFNSIENYDFTLASDSPLISMASDGTNIGGTRYAVRNQANSTAFSGSSATVDSGLTFAYTNYVISGSSVTGSVTSAPILVNNLSPKVVQRVTYNGLLAFNKDTGSASGSNVNVPDFDTYTSASGNAGANPDRLVYYMRFTSGSSVPVSDSGWENAGLWAAGTYNVFEWNTKPSIDLSGRGNGNPLFNAGDTPTFITAQWIQVQVKLRNDYLL